MKTGVKRGRGGVRKDSSEIRRPFVYSIYLTDIQVEKLGGRLDVYKRLRSHKDYIQYELDKETN